MNLDGTNLPPPLFDWLQRSATVKSAVLFGSSARRTAQSTAADGSSDFDLHIIAGDVGSLERVNWAAEAAELEYCLQVVRPATGGVRKVSVLFTAGQFDLVVVPLRLARIARVVVSFGLHRRGVARVALNEMATCLHSGYSFLKGRNGWGKFYDRIAGEMTGVRMDDRAIVQSAQAFLIEFLWVLQKLQRGELIAAQHALHRNLVETNLRLLRELRLRRGLPLPSFGLGRRIETICSPAERSMVATSARLDALELRAAAWNAFDGLCKLAPQLIEGWAVPPSFEKLIAHHPHKNSDTDTTPAR